LERCREVGVRKVLGATSRHIVSQLASQIGLLLLAAFLLAGLLGVLLLPFFNQLAGKSFTFYTFFSSPSLGVLFALLLALAVLLSGYQAFHLNQVEPVRVLKGNTQGPGKRMGIGSLLVILQFTGTVTLMSGTLVVTGQLQFLQQRELGLQPDRVLVVSLPQAEAVSRQVQAFGQRLSGSSLVEAISWCDTGGEPGSFMNKDLFLVEQEGQMREKVVTNLSCDADYLPLLDIHLRTGRNFSKDRPADLKGVYLVNEAFVRWMGWKEPLGKQIEFFGQLGEVIGVVKNFHFASLHKRVAPLIILYQQRPPEKLLLKTGTNQLPVALSLVQRIWQELLLNYPLEYSFLEAQLAEQYGQEQRVQALFNWGSALTIGIACLGLLGMASLSSRRRTREMGIRKVFGASRGSIVFLLLKGLLFQVLLGIVLALPLAWTLARRWLESFPYRIPAFGWSLAIAASMAFLLALLITLYHGLTTSRINPAVTLQFE
jgi:putative ABC transport system permease protein